MAANDYSDAELKSLIGRSMAGDVDALGELLEHYRPVLALMAREQLGKDVRVRVSESDIIQQSCGSVVNNIGHFTGSEPGEFLAWLRTIHDNNIHNSIRQHKYQKRDITKEEHFAITEELPNSEQQTPSHVAMTKERIMSLEQAIELLPPDQSRVVKLKHLDGMGISQIAEKMNRSQTAVAGLLKRGIAALREKLKD